LYPSYFLISSIAAEKSDIRGNQVTPNHTQIITYLAREFSCVRD